MKKFYKVIAAVAATVLVFTGCGADKKTGSNANLVTGEGSLITKEPSELSIFCVTSGDTYIEERPIFEKAAELTNVHLKTDLSKNISDHNQAFQILMASGELPDIVKYINRDYFMKYGEEGAFAPLEDLIDEYAPNIKKIFEDPEIRKYVTASDGHIYFLPMVQDDRPSKGWFVRQDWLDKLGMQKPTTVEEYHDVLKAFRENDMNGNGQKDEIPYFSRFTNGVDDLVGLWDATVAWGVKDGKVFYGPMQEEYKTAYSNIGKWYAEGLIDKEIYTRGGKARDELFGNNTGGTTHDWFGTTFAFNDTLKGKVDGFALSTIAPPNGVEYAKRQKANATGWAIGANSKNKEIAIRYMDFWFSEEGSRLMNYGIEGQTYDMVDGKPKFKEAILKNPDKSVLTQLNEIGAQMDTAFKQDFDYEAQWLREDAKQSMEEYNKYLTDTFPTLSYTTEEREVVDSVMGNINTYVAEVSQKFVFGSLKADDYFDEFTAQLKKMGIDKVIEVQQKAYERYQKN